MNKDSIKKIIQKIKQEKIQPEPKWKLNLKNYFFWGLILITALIGASFLSLVFLNFLDYDLETLRILQFKQFFYFFLPNFPFVWLLFIIMAITLGLFAFYKTKGGYRFSLLLSMVVFFIIILLLAIIAHFFHIDKKMEQGFLKTIPPHFCGPKGSCCFQAESGFLAGTIIFVTPKFIFLKDAKNQEWKVIYKEKTKKHPKLILQNGEEILVIGKKNDHLVFEAFMIKPFNKNSPEKRKILLKENPQSFCKQLPN